MRCEAIHIKVEICVKGCFCDIKEIACNPKEKNHGLILKEGLGRLFRRMKNFLTEHPPYTYDRKRAQNEAYKQQVAAEFYRRF